MTEISLLLVLHLKRTSLPNAGIYTNSEAIWLEKLGFGSYVSQLESEFLIYYYLIGAWFVKKAHLMWLLPPSPLMGHIPI